MTAAGHALVIGVNGGAAFTCSAWPRHRGPEARPGHSTAVAVRATPTWSGRPGRRSPPATGVAGHANTDSDLTGHRLADDPDVVTRATRAGLRTRLAVSGWPTLALPEDGGPLFAEASMTGARRRTQRPAAAWDSRDRGQQRSWDAADEAITQLAAGILAQDAPRVSFVYLGAGGQRRARQAGTGAGRTTAAPRPARSASGRPEDSHRPPRRPERPAELDDRGGTDHGHLDGGGTAAASPRSRPPGRSAAGPGIRPGALSRWSPARKKVAPLVLAAGPAPRPAQVKGGRRTGLGDRGPGHGPRPFGPGP